MFSELKNELQFTNEIRNALIAKLKDAILDKETDLTKLSSEALESYMSIMRELNNTMKTRDSNFLNFVKLQLQSDFNGTVANTSALVSEYLMHLGLNGAPIETGVRANVDESSKLLDQVAEEHQFEISEEEKEMKP